MFKWRVERRRVLVSVDSLDVVGKEIAGVQRVLELLAILSMVEGQQINIAWCLLEMQDLRPPTSDPLNQNQRTNKVICVSVTILEALP